MGEEKYGEVTLSPLVKCDNINCLLNRNITVDNTNCMFYSTKLNKKGKCVYMKGRKLSRHSRRNRQKCKTDKFKWKAFFYIFHDRNKRLH